MKPLQQRHKPWVWPLPKAVRRSCPPQRKANAKVAAAAVAVAVVAVSAKKARASHRWWTPPRPMARWSARMAPKPLHRPMRKTCKMVRARARMAAAVVVAVATAEANAATRHRQTAAPPTRT